MNRLLRGLEEPGIGELCPVHSRTGPSKTVDFTAFERIARNES
jgi:hypothetical protein